MAPADDTAGLDVRDVLDAMWLAAWLSRAGDTGSPSFRDGGAAAVPSGGPPPAQDVRASEVDALASRRGAASSVSAATGSRSASGAMAGDSSGPGLYAPPETSPPSGDVIRARPIRIPAGSALPNALPIVRALRPIPTRVASRVNLELDEAATVDASAQEQGIVPVLRPRLERWFDAALVVERSPSSEVWAQTVVDIERMLTCSGVFRDVRTFYLQPSDEKPESAARAPAAGAVTELPTLTLVNESNRALRPNALRDPAARRIIFIFSPGVSENWTNGTLGRLVAEWGSSTPVVLLHALPRRLWANTALGEPAAFAVNLSPGGSNTSLTLSRAWWARGRRIDGRRARLPVVSLDADSTYRWAEMFAARRGRRAPVFLVRTTPGPAPRAMASPGRELPMADRLALFRGNAPDAFRLAVRMAAGPFTMPILQLVHSSLFGRDAQHAQLAEMMLSGFVVRRTPLNAAVPPEHVQFEFTPEASTLLLEFLRRDDARKLSSLLQGYIQEHFGTPRDQIVLMNDPRGTVTMPSGAQPFALLSERFTRWLERSAPNVPDSIVAALQPGIGIPEEPPEPSATLHADASGNAEPSRIATLLRTFAELPRTDLPWLTGIRILWVDDKPSNNISETQSLQAMGAVCDLAPNTVTALKMLSHASYDLLISDMARPEGREAGLDLLQQVQRPMPVIIYAGQWAVNERARAQEAGAFGCTSNATELTRLVLEAADQSRVQRYVLSHVRTIDASPALKSLERSLLSMLPREAASAVFTRVGRHEQALRALPVLLSAISGSNYVQLFDAAPRHPTLIADSIAEGLARYETAALSGVIGRAVRTHQTNWVQDVRSDSEYIAAEPSTCSELAIPILQPDGVRYVVNIERDVPNAYSPAQIRWLEEFLHAYFAETPSDVRGRTPGGCHVFAVGISSYPAMGSDWNLPGAAENAVAFAEWAVTRGVPSEQVHLFISTPDHERLSARVNAIGVQPRRARMDVITRFVAGELPELDGEVLYIFWAGHAAVSTSERRALFFEELSFRRTPWFDVNGFLEALRTSAYRGFETQIAYIDASATRFEELNFDPVRGQSIFKRGDSRNDVRQTVLVGASSREPGLEGNFGRAVVDALRSEPAWPPDHEYLKHDIQSRLQEPTIRLTWSSEGPAHEPRGEVQDASPSNFKYWFYVSYSEHDLDDALRGFLQRLSQEVSRLTGDTDVMALVERDPHAKMVRRDPPHLQSASRVLLAIGSPDYYGNVTHSSDWQRFIEERELSAAPGGILPVTWVGGRGRAPAAFPFVPTHLALSIETEGDSNPYLHPLATFGRSEEYAALVRRIAAAIVRGGGGQIPDATAASDMRPEVDVPPESEAPERLDEPWPQTIREDSGTVSIIVATTRLAADDKLEAGAFGSRRGPLRVLRSSVSIPPVHVFGEIERPSLLRLQTSEQPARHVVVQTLAESSLAESVELVAQGQPVVFYVPGYNTVFEGNLKRIAVITYDLRLDQQVVLLEWPSAGAVTAYVADVAQAEAFEPTLSEVITAFGRVSGRRAIIATDLGCRPALSAIERVSGIVDDLILIQPLVDASVLQARLERVAAHVHTTIYTTPGDTALKAYALLVGQPPFGGDIGDRLPAHMADVVALRNLPGLGSYTRSRGLWTDLRDVLTGVPPNQRFGLRERDGIWELEA